MSNHFAFKIIYRDAVYTVSTDEGLSASLELHDKLSRDPEVTMLCFDSEAPAAK